jgi:hypothetical protein
VQASLPLLLDGAALARGNAVIQLVDTIDELLGPLLGSVLLHTLELRGLLLLCAVCFAVSALWERTLPIPYVPAARSCLRLPPKALFRQARPLLRLAAVLALFNLAVVPAVTVGVPLLVVRYYAFSDTALAVTQSAMSVGGLLGGVLAGAFAKRLFLRRGTAALWCITAVCALLALAFLALSTCTQIVTRVSPTPAIAPMNPILDWSHPITWATLKPVVLVPIVAATLASPSTAWVVVISLFITLISHHQSYEAHPQPRAQQHQQQDPP